MPYELYIRHYGRDGVLKSSYIEPLWARYTVSVDDQEPLVFALNEDNDAVANIEEFDILEVMMRNRELGITDFTRVFVAILRHWDMSTSDDGTTFITFTAPNEKHVLSWRSVLWPAGVTDRSEFSSKPAETVMKNLVKYNATSLATVANGRTREGSLATGMGIDITVVADSAAGDSISIGLMGKNLLKALQQVAAIGGGDFSLEWQGLNDWEFDFHPGQLGDDKSTGDDRVLFSLETQTMSSPRLKTTGSIATVTVSGGEGEGVDREFVEVNGPDYAADNDIESFTDARSEKTTDGVTYRGQLAMEEAKATNTLTFDVLQTSNQFYSPVAVVGKKTYTAGDLVLAKYGIEAVKKVTKVMVDWKSPSRDSAFQVSIEVEDA